MRRNHCDVVYSGETNRNFYVRVRKHLYTMKAKNH